ncbi:MAG TPA: choice-of-anchor Q domain-containing protein, partial [Candidatus Saccharimonadales bacterium]|nr:choice-of-anchor Q domain-containing protein [Candidatus Saccharimonadales bacterium]
CRFLGNSSSAGGGAIYNAPTAAPTVKNSLFDQNTSQFLGGAIADYGGGMVLAFCTLARNSCAYSGTGLYFQGSAATVDSCIFWKNTALQNPDGNSVEKIQVDNSTGFLAISNSIVEGSAALAGNNNLPFDPLFNDLAVGDFQLTAYSPALNSGDSAAAAGEPADVAGQPRVFGSAPDCGAYEFQSAAAGNLAILGLPQSLTTCSQTAAEFDIVTQAGDTNVFQWQMLSGPNYVAVPNSSPYALSSSGTTNSLEIPSVSLSMNGAVFRFVSLQSGYTSPSFTLAVTPPAVIYVNAAAATPGDGSSWAAALTNLQTAILEGNVCSEIWVARGVYSSTVAPDGNPSLVMKQGLRIYGGFAGFETDFSQRNWKTNIVVLKSVTNAAVLENIGGAGSIDSSALLDGFTIDGGNSSGNAILNINASPTFQNCLFVNGSPAIWNASGANPVILNCVFSNNPVQAMVNEECAPVISNCVFVANSGVNLEGGALYNFNANPAILACQFLNNSASQGAAMALDGNSQAVVQRSFFEGNAASAVGAVYCANSSALFADDVFAGNLAYQGGAVFVNNSTMILNNCTLTGNAASSTGGGVLLEGGFLSATNSILWNNTDATGSSETAQINDQSGAVALGHSIITGLAAYAGNQNMGFDPLFQSVAGNNFTPSSASPAINAGDNTAVAAGDTDFNGNPRVVASVVDIGAIEVQNSATTAVYLAAQAAPQTTCPGGTASFTVTGAANSGSQFVWQVDTGGGFQAIPNDGFQFVTANNNSSTLTISNTPANYNYSYRFLIPAASYVSPSYPLTVLPPRIIYVNASATGNNTGLDWAGAFTNFAAALASGDACSQVWVAAGTYTSAAGRPAQMQSGLAVYGGFAGTETSLSQRQWASHPAILTSSAGVNVIFNQGYLAPIGRSAILDGFFITSGGPQNAIENVQASPTLRNCVFQSNVLYAIENIGSSPWIDSCLFTNNANVVVDIVGGAPTMTNCVFAANQATGSGAAVYASSGAQTALLDCAFNGNTSGGDGGAIANDGATIAVVNSIFAGNAAAGVGGAAVNFSGGAAFITNSVFYGGTAFGSAAIYNAGALTLVNCTIAGNVTQSEGGGVSTYGPATLLNTILWQNTTTLSPPPLEGQQIFDYSGVVAATNCLMQGLAVYAGNGDIGSDPLFLDPAHGNYQLSPSSPAINAGLNFVNSSGVDAAGQPRVQLGTIDLGAYESATVQSSNIQLVATPASQSICASRSAAFTVRSQDPQIFDWQYFDGTNWNGFTYDAGSGAWIGPALGAYQISSNATSSTLTVASASVAMNGYEYRFIIPGSYTGATLVLTVSPAAIIYVNAGAGLGGDGQSWGGAFNNLQSALAAVAGCRDEIWVAAGSYAPALGTNPVINFSIPPGAALYGGFTGTETSRALRNWRNNPTILSGLNSQNIAVIDGTVTPIGPETVLDGFILQGASGAAMNIINASPAIQNCVFRRSSPGAFVFNSDSAFANCSFLSNYCSEGGGLQVFSGNISFLNCFFTGNSASANGGALYDQSGNLNLTNCLITGNSAVYGGGVGCAIAGTAAFVNCTISDNLATGGGAGLQGSQTNLLVANSILWNNQVNGVADESAQVSSTFGSVNISFSCLEGLTNSGNNNTADDPLFENPAAGQYTLESCSPAINAGTNVDIPGIATDLAGLPRLVNAVDLGAYEYQGTPSATLAILTQPSSLEYCENGSNYFAVSASGAGLSFQWQANVGDGHGFTALSENGMFTGATSSVLVVNSASVTNNGMNVRCVINSAAGCSIVSASATLTYASTRWFVNAAAPPGGNGSSWPRAFNSIDQALAATFQGCNNEIWVATGIYVPPAQGYALRDKVALYGGFFGSETSLTQRNWTNSPAIIDGRNAVSFLIQNLDEAAPIGPLARLDGFTLQNAASCAITNYQDQTPTLANCVFRSNGGSAIFNVNSGGLVTNCVFLQNGSIANAGGGAINNISADVAMRLENCVFQGNVGGTSGGAISDSFGVLTLVNCLFSGNYAVNYGGAVSAGGEGASVVVRNCTFSGNESGFPGAAVDFGVPCLVYNSIFWNNYTPYGTDAQHTNEEAQVTIFNDGTSRVFNSCIEGLVVSGGQFSGNGNTGGDPHFVKNIDGSAAPEAGGDFHLGSCSSALDAGDNSQVTLASDLDGNPRILGNAVDLGAYEGAGAIASFVTQPQAQSGYLSNTVQFTVSASKPNLSYQWQFQQTSNGVFTNLTNDAQYSGVTTPSLTVSDVTSALAGFQYRCAVVDQCSLIFSAPAAFHFLYAQPVVSNIQVSAFEGGFSALGQLQGFDPQGLPLTYTVLAPPANGMVDLSASPEFQYIPSNRRFFGADSFTYYASNGFTNSAPATVFVTIVKVEQNPTANNLSVSALENTPTNFTLSGSDVNGDPLTFFIAVPPQHGALNLIGSNAFYTPATNYSGTDVIVYQSSNGVYASGIGTISISVIHGNRPPVAQPDAATLYTGQSVTIAVLQNDYDLDNNPLSVVGVTQGANGSVAFTSANLTYTHNGSNTTNDSFAYTIADGQGNYVTSSVSIVILQPGGSYLVTNTADNGPGSLRAAINGANTVTGIPYQIIFSSTLAGKTIALSTVDDNGFGPSAFVLSNSVTIDAANAPGLILARQAAASPMRFFRVVAGAQLALRNITLTNGYALGANGADGADGEGSGGGAGGFGGAIYSEGILSLD